MISMQVWRIHCEKIGVNMLNERLEEAVGVYAKNYCSIPCGNGEIHPGPDKLGDYW